MISSGDIFLLDNAVPFELDLKSQGLFDSHVVRLRRTASLENRTPTLLAFGHRYSGHRLMPLLRMNLAQMARTGDAASDAEIGYYGQTVARLVDLILTDESIETVASRSGEAWRLIRAEINRHIGDQEFTLEILAGRLGVSPRYVQKVCAAQDCTFSGYLRDRRLELAAHRLRGKSNRPSVEQVAHSCGYRDLSTFYRAFRRRYGMDTGRIPPLTPCPRTGFLRNRRPASAASCRGSPGECQNRRRDRPSCRRRFPFSGAMNPNPARFPIQATTRTLPHAFRRPRRIRPARKSGPGNRPAAATSTISIGRSPARLTTRNCRSANTRSSSIRSARPTA